MPLPLPDPDTRRPAHILHYNPLWMDSVFKSRAATEALLAPEREAGYLTPHDYDASISFLTDYHRQYPIIGALAATALIYPFRPAKWNQAKRAATTFTFGFGGYAFGRVAFLNAHFNYLRSIENPHGFQNAMEHIQSQIGKPNGGIVIERAYELSPDDMDPDQALESVSQLVLPNPSVRTQPDTLAPSRPTKWDEIRKANSHSAQNSSWDKLRENHERRGIKSKAPEEPSWTIDSSSEQVDTDPYATKDFSRRTG